MSQTTEPCLEEGPDCAGVVEFHSYGQRLKAFPRCCKHHRDRLAVERGIEERYPQHAPADFDPSYAGERWDED